MNDRELRDALERLHAELADARRELAETTVDSLVEAERHALTAEVAALEQRRAAAIETRADAQRRHRQDEGELEASRDALRAARRKVAKLEPLGDPNAVSLANWENPNAAGCLPLVLLGAFVWWWL